jgi:hypothetical protein
MKKISLTNWILDFLEKQNKIIRLVIKSLILIMGIVYIGYFIKFGIGFGQTNIPTFKTLLIGLLLPILAIIIFFIMHFSGGVDFNLKMIGLPIGLAIGGTAMGLISGLIYGFKGWLVGGLIGGIIILLTVWPYLKKKDSKNSQSNITGDYPTE